MRLLRLTGLPGPLGVLGGVAVPVLLASLLHLGLSIYGPAFAAPEARVADFSFYYDAAGRFGAEPGALYEEARARPGAGFVYPPPGVVPFLPLALLPMPVAFLLMGLATVVLVVVAVRLTLGLYGRVTGEALPGGPERSLLLIGLATAPVLQNLRFGQVNGLVLVSGLAFLALLGRSRPAAAGGALALGFWLKLYPLALAPLGLGRAGRLSAGLALGLAGVPLLLAPLVPLDLYWAYFTELLPAQAGATVPDALNQSLPAVLERLRRPPEAAFQLTPVPLHPAVEAATGLLALGLLGGLVAAALAGRLPREVAGVGVLAALPVVSVLGWEHTYMMAVPLVLFAVPMARGRSRVVQAAVAASVLALMMPKPPRGVMERLLEAAPRGLSDALYARFPAAVLVLLALVVAWTWRRGGPAAGAAGRQEEACAGEAASLR